MSDFDPDAFLAAPATDAHGDFDPDAFLAEQKPQPKSFLDRAKDVASNVVSKTGESFANLGHTLASAGRGALDLVSPVSKEGGLQVPFGQLADPAYRHELERGVSDTVTGGLATKAANAVDQGFAAGEASEHEAAPNARALGQVGGTALPSPFNYIGGQAAKLVPGAGPLAAATKGVVGYEASSVPQAVVAAEPGHRAEAAAEAATNPAGIVTSAAIPAVTSYLAKRLDVAAAKAPEVEAAAKQRAVKDLGKDITSAEGVSARATDKQKVAEVNDRLYDLADKNPELRQAFSEPAEKALPKIQEWKAKIAEPLDRLYDAIDAKTDGGLDPVKTVAALRKMAKDVITPGVSDAPVAGIGDADRLNHLADQFERIYITDREAPTSQAPATRQHGVGEAPEWTDAQWKEARREWEGKKGHSTVGDITNPGAKGGESPPRIDNPEATEKAVERDPGDLIPVHRAEDTRKVSQLSESMKKNGWVGDPILAVDDQAWTGSHRLAAAKEAGIDAQVYQWSPTAEQVERLRGEVNKNFSPRDQDSALIAMEDMAEDGDIDPIALKLYKAEIEKKIPITDVGETVNAGGKGAPTGEGLGDALADLEKLRKNAKGVAAKGIDEQIAKLRAEQEAGAAPAEATRSPIAPAKIPTRIFRNEVTELLKKTDSSYGAIEGSVRHQMLAKLYDAGKKIIDEHIDGSGIPDAQKAQVRDINNGYFLASRAEAAIESRGVKEANKPGFKFPTTVRQAVHGGGLAGLATAAALGGPGAVVHALPYVAGTALVTHALPKIMKSINWDMAHGGYTRAIQNLAKVAKATATVGQFVSQATRAGLAADQARRVWEAAHKTSTPVTPSDSGDITL